jgi:hypothetical protein
MPSAMSRGRGWVGSPAGVVAAQIIVSFQAPWMLALLLFEPAEPHFVSGWGILFQVPFWQVGVAL